VSPGTASKPRSKVAERQESLELLSSLPTERDIGGLGALAKFYGPEAITASFVACTTDEPFDLPGGVTAISGWTSLALS
jgi:hypothetical protein